jgi:hypothetical protein
MKKIKPNYYIEIIGILMELKKEYPNCNIGKHISTALDDYGDIWGLPDKEVLYAFTKYKATLEMDVHRETNDEELEQIIKDGMNLKDISSLDDDELNDY